MNLFQALQAHVHFDNAVSDWITPQEESSYCKLTSYTLRQDLLPDRKQEAKDFEKVYQNCDIL